MRITGREKMFLWGGGILLLALFLVLGVLNPLLQRNRELDRLIAQKGKDLKEIRLLRMEFDALKERRALILQKIQPGEKGQSPLAKLDHLIDRANLRPHVKAIKPSPSTGAGGETMTVEVLMEKADLPQVTRFLYEIQSSPGGFRVSRLTIKPRYTTPRFLDVTLQMVFYQG